jgi:hypothetical protein
VSISWVLLMDLYGEIVHFLTPGFKLNKILSVVL